MSQITLRGMDPEMEQEIRSMAQKKGKSLSVSLRKLAGTWSEKDSSEFLESIKSCEQIDEEMWK